MSHIIILGGHGKVALLTAPLLAAAGHQVTSVIRNPAHAADVASTGAEPLVADLETLDVDAIAALLAGADAVVWSAGAGGGNPARTYAVDRDAAIRSMDAAGAAGVRRYLMVSWLGSVPGHGIDQANSFFAYADAKLAADDYLRQTRLDWTILGPGRLSLDAATGSIDILPAGASGPALTSRGNVASVIAATLEDADSTVGRFIGFADGTTPIAEAIRL